MVAVVVDVDEHDDWPGRFFDRLLLLALNVAG
jgi:hypothetical protein